MLSNCLLNIYTYTQRLVLFSALMGEASIYNEWGWGGVEAHGCLGRQESDCWVLSPKLDSQITPPDAQKTYQKRKGYKSQMIMKRAIKHYLLGMINSLQSRAHRSCDCLHKTGPINSWSWELMRSHPSLGNY